MNDDITDKGIDNAQHYTSCEGWTRDNLDFFTVTPKNFTDEEHDIWRGLYKRQSEVLKGRAIDLFMDSLSTLGINQDRIPHFAEVNEILMKRTGWQVVPVPGLIPDEAFLELLSHRRFPIGNFIRGKNQMDYIQEPDVFHDLFGHVPILADPMFGDYMQAYGEGGLRALKHNAIDKLARLYWYTVEFGLIQENGKTHIYGAGILTSPTESVFSLESDSPHRIEFNLERVLQTRFHIDDFQDNYFVINDFQQLFDETYQNFDPIYTALDGKQEYNAGLIIEGDKVLHKGTSTYAIESAARRKQKKEG